MTRLFALLFALVLALVLATSTQAAHISAALCLSATLVAMDARQRFTVDQVATVCTTRITPNLTGPTRTGRRATIR